MGTVVVVLLVVVLVLFLALGLGVRNARRSMTGSGRGDAQHTAGTLGRELFDRSRRLDVVIEQASQARALALHVDSLHTGEIDVLADRLEEACEAQRRRVVAVAPLTGRPRDVAIERLEPGIQGLEEAGAHLIALGDKAAATADPARASSEAELVGRQAHALEAALEELEDLDLIDPVSGTLAPPVVPGAEDRGEELRRSQEPPQAAG